MIPKLYREAFKKLYNTRRWGPRLLRETCRQFNISPQNMLRTYCVLLVVHLSRSKSFRRPTSRQGEAVSDETLQNVRETLLAASFSGYSNRQHADALVNGTQVQLNLRQRARYVDPQLEQQSFLRAVCSLPHAQHVSDEARMQIANKLRAFHQSHHFRSGGNTTKLHPVAPLVRHLSRYRLYANVWRHHLLIGSSSSLYADLSTFADDLCLGRDVVDAGIKAVANAFETDSAALKFGEQFRVFDSLLNGKSSSLWQRFVASKEGTNSVSSIGFGWFGRHTNVGRIAQAVGSRDMEAFREDPGRLLDASHISSDDFYKVATNLAKEDVQYAQLRQLFEALCARTSAADCRETARLIWKEGGLSWLRKALVNDICRKAALTDDEARRIQGFARGYFCSRARTSGRT